MPLPFPFPILQVKKLREKGLFQDFSDGPGIPTPQIRTLSSVTCYLCYRMLAQCSFGSTRDLNALSSLAGESKLTQKLGKQ